MWPLIANCCGKLQGALHGSSSHMCFLHRKEAPIQDYLLNPLLSGRAQAP